MKEEDKRLSEILNNEEFPYVLDLFLDSLKKHRDWKALENRIQEIKEKWDNDKIKLLFKWERRAFHQYSYAQDLSMNAIKMICSKISLEKFKELEGWIKISKNSKLAWEKNIISISDSLSIIMARIAHLIYVCKSEKPVNIGSLIKK